MEVSKSSPPNEMLKEKLMAQVENDKEKKKYPTIWDARATAVHWEQVHTKLPNSTLFPFV